MFRGDTGVIDLGDVDAAVQFTPKTVEQTAMVLDPFLIGVKVMLKISRQTVLIGGFTLRLQDAVFGQRLHRNIQRFCELIDSFSRALLKLGLPAADIIECSVWNTCVNSESVFRHLALGQQVIYDHAENTSLFGL